jgi:hypothetical protein
MRRFAIGVGLGLSLVAAAKSARADGADKLKDVLVIAQGGAFSDHENNKGDIFAMSFLFREDAFGGGISFEYAVTGTNYQMTTAGLEGGIFFPFPRQIRLGVLGVAGLHRYSAVPSQLFLSSTGASDTLAYVGGRILAGVEIGKKRRLHVGLEGFLDDDLWRTARTNGQPGDDPFGTTRSGVMLVLGGAADL